MITFLPSCCHLCGALWHACVWCLRVMSLLNMGGVDGRRSTCLRSMCRTCADVPLSFAVQLCAVTAVDPSAFILPGDDARLEFLELSCNVSTSS